MQKEIEINIWNQICMNYTRKVKENAINTNLINYPLWRKMVFILHLNLYNCGFTTL